MLADVTGKNPNVFYELGLAHALGKPVVIVTKSMEDVPFDLRALRVIQYDVQDPEWSDVLGAKITKALEEVLQAPEEAVPPPFLSEKNVTKPTSVTPTHKAILKLQQDVDLVRAEMRSRGDMSEIMGPAEAEIVLQRYLRAGMPDRMIIDRLKRRGVPVGWLEEQIERFRSKKKREPVAPTSEATPAKGEKPDPTANS